MIANFIGVGVDVGEGEMFVGEAMIVFVGRGATEIVTGWGVEDGSSGDGLEGGEVGSVVNGLEKSQPETAMRERIINKKNKICFLWSFTIY